MLKGTRVLFGPEADEFVGVIDRLRRCARSGGWDELIVPALWEESLFADKAAGSPVLDQMWTFRDKGDRAVCLIPEVTAVAQHLYRESWAKSRPKPVRLFYVARCYRYDRPQLGRYREFTQFGVESLGDPDDGPTIAFLKAVLDGFGLAYRFVPAVKRGLTYYSGDGFEVECDALGAQKQVAGGGRYADGIGWAVGVERLVLALAAQTARGARE